MSYRNPQQVVDTQSGQHIRNLQASLDKTEANMFASYKESQEKLAKEAKANKDKNDKIINANQLQEDKILGRFEKMRVNNPEMNFNAAREMIDQYNDLKNSIDLGKVTDPSEIAAIRKTMAQIETMPDSIATTFEGLGASGLEYSETKDNAGREGGLDTTNQSSSVLQHLGVFNNTVGGIRDFKIQTNKNGDIEYGIFLKSDEEGDEGAFYTRKNMEDVLAGKTKSVLRIPDETKNKETMKGLIVKDNMVKEEFFKKERVGVVNEAGNTVYQNEIDTDKVRETVKDMAKANIGSLEMTGILSYYSNILKPYNKKEDKGIEYTLEEITDAFNDSNKENETRQAIENAYVDQFMDQHSFKVRKDAVTVKNKETDDGKLTTKQEKEIKKQELNKITRDKVKRIDAYKDDLTIDGANAEDDIQRIIDFAGSLDLGVVANRMLNSDKTPNLKIEVTGKNKEKYIILPSFDTKKIKEVLKKAAFGDPENYQESSDNKGDNEATDAFGNKI